MAVRTWRTAAALAIVALFLASGTAIASARPTQASFANHLGFRVSCLSSSPPAGSTDPGGWRQATATSPVADHRVLVLVSRLSDLRLCYSGPDVSAVAYCPAGGVDKRFLRCVSTKFGPDVLLIVGGAAPEVGALTVLLPDGTALDAVVEGGAFVAAGSRAVTDDSASLRLRVSDHDGRSLYDGALFPPGT